MRGLPQLPSIAKPTQQLNLSFGPRPLSGLSTTDRARSVTLLAFLLTQAAGAATEERDDVER